MTANPQNSKQPLIVGTNHQSGGLSLRDRLFVEDADVPAFLKRLSVAGIPQAVVVSTCDRVEVGTICGDIDGAADILAGALCAHSGLSSDDVAPSLYRLTGDDAIRHLFRVTSSLDSVVVGEPQVLGQVKACHRLARDAGMVSAPLEAMFQAAYTTAKRVRTETAIGERPVSIAAVAAGLASDVHGDLKDAHGLVLGVGDMGEVIAGELIRAGLGTLSVADLGGRSALKLAERMAARHVPEDALAGGMVDADIIVAAVGGRGRSLTADMVRAALKARRFRPQFIVDASLPSDVEAAVDRLEDAFLYDLADLERLALEGRANRAFEAEGAVRIVEEELAAFLKRDRERSAQPALVALRKHAEALRDEALVEAGGDAARATHIFLQRLLHTPSERLREIAERGEDIGSAERLIRELFNIPKDGEPKL